MTLTKLGNVAAQGVASGFDRLFGVGTALYVGGEGWVSGLLLSLCASTLALMLIQFAAILGKWYFYGLVALTHGLALIDLVS